MDIVVQTLIKKSSDYCEITNDSSKEQTGNSDTTKAHCIRTHANKILTYISYIMHTE
jgi:hypothetical protein